MKNTAASSVQENMYLRWCFTHSSLLLSAYCVAVSLAAVSLAAVSVGAVSVGAADEINQPVASAFHAGERAAPGLNPAIFEQNASLESLQPTDPLYGPGAPVLPVAFQTPASSAEGLATPNGQQNVADASRFVGSYESRGDLRQVGVDLYSPPEFDGGLLIFGNDIAMKIGGYVKADFIYDFDPIESTDTFDTTTIPVGALPRTNARFHARQTRLSFDTRWDTQDTDVRIYVEGDFFSEGNRFRLRQAYGERGRFLVGQTWTTFTDVAAAPATLDFEGSVSAVNRRQAQFRLTGELSPRVNYAFSIEDTRFIIEPPMDVQGKARSPTPDFVGRLRWNNDWGRFQVAYLYRTLGFQPVGEKVLTSHGWGINTSGVVLLTNTCKAYSQVVFGEGIGSYRDLPDAAPGLDSGAGLLGLFGYMVGFTKEWNETLSSNFTYAENSLDNEPGQRLDEVSRTTYFAANLLAQPLDRVTVGIEFLHGLRQNKDGNSGEANRVQFALIFDLP
ncbi:porin [Rubripirellula sp.]|nr:porin [Rubripirellula sp.]